MSLKAFFLILLVIIFGAFIYLKVMVSGSPTSSFNQTTRFTLASYPIMRTILGLHNVGDSRSDYLNPGSPITIEWFKPEDDNGEYLNQTLMDKFAAVVQNYTGRTTNIIYGGDLDDGTIAISDLATYKLKAAAQIPAGAVLLVFFAEDYTPRPDSQLSTTYQDSGMVLSLSAHMSFFPDYGSNPDNYLLPSMLHEFGSQIGMKENSEAANDPSCIMNVDPGFGGKPLEASGLSEPQDFCPAEQAEIQNLKLQFGR
jgi:hypothetical protein